MTDKKIIQISKQEILFLRKMMLNVYSKSIDRPGDKYGYQDLSQHITDILNIDPSEQRHSAGLLHKLMHDEGQNKDFLNVCYRYISDNKYDREGYIAHIGLDSDKDEPHNGQQSHDEDFWQKRFKWLALFTTLSCLGFATYWLYSWMSERNKPVIWNMTTAWNADSYTQKKYLENFIERINKETNGRMEIHIYPDFQLPSSNGNNKTKEEVREALTANDVQILHSGPHINFKDNPEAVVFSTIPFGKNYKQMIAWMHRPMIKKTLLNLYEKQNILTYQGGHSGPQYGGWYMEMPKDSSFFINKTVRFANFAGYLLSHPNVGAKQKSMLRYQFSKMFDHIKFDVVEWSNPEEDVSMGMHLKGFKYYDRSHWNEPNSMFCFYINKDAINSLPTDLKQILISTIEKIGEQKIFNEDNPNRQLAENTIENTFAAGTSQKIKIFDLEHDVPDLYQFLQRQNKSLLADFFLKNPKAMWLYDDYCKN